MYFAFSYTVAITHYPSDCPFPSLYICFSCSSPLFPFLLRDRSPSCYSNGCLSSPVLIRSYVAVLVWQHAAALCVVRGDAIIQGRRDLGAFFSFCWAPVCPSSLCASLRPTHTHHVERHPSLLLLESHCAGAGGYLSRSLASCPVCYFITKAFHAPAARALFLYLTSK